MHHSVVRFAPCTQSRAELVLEFPKIATQELAFGIPVKWNEMNSRNFAKPTKILIFLFSKSILFDKSNQFDLSRNDAHV